MCNFRRDIFHCRCAHHYYVKCWKATALLHNRPDKYTDHDLFHCYDKVVDDKTVTRTFCCSLGCCFKDDKGVLEVIDNIEDLQQKLAGLSGMTADQANPGGDEPRRINSGFEESRARGMRDLVDEYRKSRAQVGKVGARKWHEACLKNYLERLDIEMSKYEPLKRLERYEYPDRMLDRELSDFIVTGSCKCNTCQGRCHNSASAAKEEGGGVLKALKRSFNMSSGEKR